MTTNTPPPDAQPDVESTSVELTVSAVDSQVSSVRLVATLAIAAMLSGLLLAAAYEITLPIIEANNAEALQAAVFKVVPDSTQLQPLVWDEDKEELVAWSPKKSADGAGEESSASEEPPAGLVIYGAYDENRQFIGYAIEAAGAGFQDTIRLLYGFNPRAVLPDEPRHITGMEILESRETPGLGDKIYKDPKFAENFLFLTVDPSIELVKDNPTAKNQVDAITGATISSKAVVKILQKSTADWLPRLPKPGDEPAFIVIDDEQQQQQQEAEQPPAEESSEDAESDTEGEEDPDNG
ncbi:MAG: FMN-binding protein [Planctomycetes bacterium]|nr:FMN-binding protein [Planctomycetota bacterium]NOG55842.1 FMN-binding protein [Planctomycetota bacterium]